MALVIGAFHVNFGGVTEFLLGIVMTAVLQPFPKRILASARIAAVKIFIKTPTHWILGFHLLFGRSQLSVGLIRQKI